MRVRMMQPKGLRFPFDTGAELFFDVELDQAPAKGDSINFAGGMYVVRDVAWNFDPQMPFEVVLMVAARVDSEAVWGS